MTVVMHTGLYSALTAPSMTRMTLLTYELLVYFFTNLDFPCALNSNRDDDNWLVGRLRA